MNIGRYSLNKFIESTGEHDLGQGVFELERDRLLEVNLEGMVWTKRGSMVGYTGDIKFIREGLLEHGFGKLMKKSLTGEGVSLTKAEGKGKLYLADSGKKISVLNLENEAIFVNGNDLLAFDSAFKEELFLP